jgi:hypothetical protein
MSSPSFITIGADGHQAFGETINLPLPASLVAGNLLIGFVTSTGVSVGFTWPVGWTEIVNVENINGSASVAYYYVTGSDVAPDVTWTTGNTSADGYLLQFSGVVASSPIGAFNHTGDYGTLGSTFSGGSLATTGTASVVLDLENANAGTLATPAGYTAVSGPANSMLFASEDMAAPGTTTAISYDLGAPARWVDFQIEILSQAIINTVHLTADFTDNAAFDATLTLTKFLSLAANFLDADSAFDATMTLDFGPPPPPELPPSIPPISVIVINR